MRILALSTVTSNRGLIRESGGARNGVRPELAAASTVDVRSRRIIR
jgi:hypothetical protein